MESPPLVASPRSQSDPSYGEEDLGYTWEHLQEVARLYALAAADGCAVVFTVDQ